MSKFEKNGKIEEIYKEVYEEKEIEWKIADFFSIAENKIIQSPAFCFSNSSWYFRMCPKYNDKPFGRFCLLSTKPLQYSVKFDFGLKKLDNSVVELGSGIFEKKIKNCIVHSTLNYRKYRNLSVRWRLWMCLLSGAHLCVKEVPLINQVYETNQNRRN